MQTMVDLRIVFKIIKRQSEQCSRRGWTLFFQMHKCACQLNKPFIKRSVGTLPVGQPQIFKHFMCFKESSLIEAFKISEVVSIELLAKEGLDQSIDLFTLLAHARILDCAGERPSWKQASL